MELGILDCDRCLGRDAERVQMPLTSERVWRALQGDKAASPFGAA